MRHSIGLNHPDLQTVLHREHERAKGDDAKLAQVRPKLDAARRDGKTFTELGALYPKDTYLSVAPEMGQFLYLTARSIGAKRIVEFGTSFGISTLYLGAAARDEGGRVISSELEPTKLERARANLAEAGLADHVELREGDAMETLQDVAAPVDLLFLDGWKDLYLPLLDLLEPKLRPGSVVLADNIFTFPQELKAYVESVTSASRPCHSVVLPFSTGLAYSLYMPEASE